MLVAVVVVLLTLSHRVGSYLRVITVDQRSDSPACDSLWSGESLSNFSCDSLQYVLSTIPMERDSDVEVQIAEGHYNLTDSVTIKQNITLRAEVPGAVHVNFNDLLKDSFYAILFTSAKHTAIEGISFEWSHRGIIVFENVSQVSILSLIHI